MPVAKPSALIAGHCSSVRPDSIPLARCAAIVSRPFTVIQLVPALDSGGVERAVIEISQALVRAGHRALVVSAGGRLEPELSRIGAEHIRLDIGHKSLWSLRHVVALRRLFRQVDIVHARSRLPAWLGWMAWKSMRGRRPCFVTTVHGLNSVGGYSGVMMRGERVIAVSNTVRDHIIQHYPETSVDRIRVIPRSLDPEQFPHGYRASAAWRAAFDTEYPIAAGRRWICLPGRGTRLKGHDDALRLLAALRAVGADVVLILLGAQQADRSAYVDELRGEATRLGVADSLVITPPRSDVRDVMSQCAFVLQLSRKPEAFGRTVVEALHLGVPVMGWSHGGVGELLTELYPGGRIALGDEHALLLRAQEFLTEAPSPAAFGHYRLEQMQAATLAVYQELLDEAAR
jgi:glycosyltransferase involved in cell wall biosynthesis